MDHRQVRGATLRPGLCLPAADMSHSAARLSALFLCELEQVLRSAPSRTGSAALSSSLNHPRSVPLLEHASMLNVERAYSVE